MATPPTRLKPWSVELDRDIESGAAIQLRSPEPGVVTFWAPWDSSPLPMWFHFRIRGAKGWTVRFVLMNANRCLGGEKSYADLRVRPVVTEDPPTARPSKRRWRRVSAGHLSYDGESGRFSFTVRIRSDEAYVAHCYPYGLAEWNELARDLRRHKGVAVGVLGATEKGRPMPLASITDGRPDGRKVIWLTARHHSGETPGSWALEGTLRWILSNDPSARRLRKRYLVRVVPFADLDGVVEGFYGKERAPLDFNRAYLEDTPRPEIELILREVLGFSRRNVAFFDYHAPGAGGPHQVFMKTKGATSTWRRELCWEYGRALLDASPPRSKLAAKNLEEPLYQGDESETTSTGGVYLSTGILTMTNEVSYALTADNHVLTRRDYLAYGAAIGRAVSKVLEAHADEIEARGLIEREEERTPFAEYSGTAFRGGFQWVPARQATFDSARDRSGEILGVMLQGDTAFVHLACPRGKMGKRRTLQLDYRFLSDAKEGALAGQATLFYYGKRGLRFRREAKLTLDIRRGKKWRAYRVDLDPPKGARTVRLSLCLRGGPGRLELRPLVLR